jgi:hypothetical protein
MFFGGITFSCALMQDPLPLVRKQQCLESVAKPIFPCHPERHQGSRKLLKRVLCVIMNEMKDLNLLK